MDYNTCLVTGGTGTFGTVYITSAITNKWHKKIIVYSRDEYKQIKMFSFLKEFFKDEIFDKELKPYSLKINEISIRFFVGDICDYQRLLIATKGVDLVIHAAALKHVPICEYNPIEATKINIGGTTNVVNACGFNSVKRLVALSTDKAVDPINMYGATKLCLEKVVLGGNRYYPTTTMNVVRYGNIIGSRGSIIHKLLTHNGDTIDLTNPNMTRFWLTIEDAIALVRKSLDFKKGEMIFVPKLKALRLDELFKFIRPDLKVNIIGSRCGEKMHEKMIAEEDLKRTILRPDLDYYIIDMSPMRGLAGDIVGIKSYTSDAVDVFSMKDFLLKLKGSMINRIYNIQSKGMA